jgi:hypothetical protein
MAADNDELIPQLLRRAQGVYGWSEVPRIEKRVDRAYPLSNIARLDIVCNGEAKTLFIKKLSISENGDDALTASVSKEFEILGRLYSSFASLRNLGVVRPVAVFPEFQVVVTEGAPGLSLSEVISRAGKRLSSRKDLERGIEHCGLAGQWLRHFQTLTRQGEQAFNVEGLIRYCDSRLDLLVKADRSGIGSGEKTKIINKIMMWNEKSKPEQNMVTGRHNDFAPNNIIADNDRLIVLDFTYFDYDSYAYDVCGFLRGFINLGVNPMSSRSKILALRDAFFAGYGGRVDLSAPQFRMAACRFHIEVLLNRLDDCFGLAPGAWMTRRLYAQSLRWLLDQ